MSPFPSNPPVKWSVWFCGELDIFWWGREWKVSSPLWPPPLSSYTVFTALFISFGCWSPSDEPTRCTSGPGHTSQLETRPQIQSPIQSSRSSPKLCFTETQWSSLYRGTCKRGGQGSVVCLLSRRLNKLHFGSRTAAGLWRSSAVDQSWFQLTAGGTGRFSSRWKPTNGSSICKDVCSWCPTYCLTTLHAACTSAEKETQMEADVAPYCLLLTTSVAFTVHP